MLYYALLSCAMLRCAMLRCAELCVLSYAVLCVLSCRMLCLPKLCSAELSFAVLYQCYAPLRFAVLCIALLMLC